MLSRTAILVLALSVTAAMSTASVADHRSSWRNGIVDPAHEHLELRFGSRDDRFDDCMVVARVGRPVDGVFPVQFTVPTDDRRFAGATAAVRRELDYFLVEHGAADPWEYAIYHTKTLANLYSRVHWLWVTPEASRPTE